MKILYIQHAGSPGGSNNSLLFTLQAMDPKRYEPIVAMVFPSEWGTDFYPSAGFKVIKAPDLCVFRHTTAGWGCLSKPRSLIELGRNICRWRQGGKAALKLVEQEKPDLVHLNSVILAAVAAAFLKEGIPFVWHVRESPVRGYFGWRYGMLRKLLLRAGKRVIFISEADKHAWVGGACGTVVHNFVDMERFHPAVDPTPVRTRLELPEDGIPTILYLGGFAEIKGIFVLLEAFRLLKDSGLQFRCLMPGCLDHYRPSGIRGKLRTVANRIGFQDDGTRAMQLIERYNLNALCHLLPFDQDIPGLLAVSDLLTFPSTRPHFARPVVEAAAVGKPSVASDLAGVSELVEHWETGLLVPANDPRALAKSLEVLLRDRTKSMRMGRTAHASALLRFDSKKQIQKIMEVYGRVIPQKRKL